MCRVLFSPFLIPIDSSSVAHQCTNTKTHTDVHRRLYLIPWHGPAQGHDCLAHLIHCITLHSQSLLSATSLSLSSTLKLWPSVSPLWRHYGSWGILAFLHFEQSWERTRLQLCCRSISCVCTLAVMCKRVSMCMIDNCVCMTIQRIYSFSRLSVFSSRRCVWQHNQVLYGGPVITLAAASTISVLKSIYFSKMWIAVYCCRELHRRIHIQHLLQL